MPKRKLWPNRASPVVRYQPNAGSDQLGNLKVKTQMATKTKTVTKRTANKATGKASTAKLITPNGRLLECMKAWQVKLAGAKPTAETIAAAGALLSRQGTSKHLALAMYMRPDGATQTETIAGTRDTQINAYHEAVRSGVLAPVTLPARNGHKVYALALPKAKAPRKVKAKAAKPAKADQPAAPDADQA